MIKEPIYLGILQSDLDFDGHNPVNLTGWPPTGGGAVTVPGQSHQTTATELLNSINGTRTPIAALATSLGNFFDSQSMDPCIVVNPADSTQLIMIFTGVAAPVSTGLITIGRATASIYDPTTWTVSNSGNPVLTPTLSYETGGLGVRADGLLYNPADGKLYLFYTAKESTTGATCALASSTDLGLTWTKLGQILTPTAPEETCGCLSVFMEGTTLHGVYSYRQSGVIRNYRYASASTSNWLAWTKGGVDIYTDSGRDLEYHHLFKIGPTYLLVYESGSFSPGTPWDIRFATSTSPSSTFTRSPNTPFFVKSGLAGTFDQYHVATPQVVVINGYYYLFYTGAIDHAYPVTDNHWQMGVTPLLTSIQASSLYIGTDLRIVPIAGGGKLQARNPATNTWVDADSWTNP
jgi:hypothetical protein